MQSCSQRSLEACTQQALQWCLSYVSGACIGNSREHRAQTSRVQNLWDNRMKTSWKPSKKWGGILKMSWGVLSEASHTRLVRGTLRGTMSGSEREECSWRARDQIRKGLESHPRSVILSSDRWFDTQFCVSLFLWGTSTNTNGKAPKG